MPCYDSRTDYNGMKRELTRLDDQLREVCVRLDAATRTACELGKIVMRFTKDQVQISLASRHWLQEHCKEDVKRTKSGNHFLKAR